MNSKSKGTDDDLDDFVIPSTSSKRPALKKLKPDQKQNQTGDQKSRQTKTSSQNCVQVAFKWSGSPLIDKLKSYPSNKPPQQVEFKLQESK